LPNFRSNSWADGTQASRCTSALFTRNQAPFTKAQDSLGVK
jgi:hypothetical protein